LSSPFVHLDYSPPAPRAAGLLPLEGGRNFRDLGGYPAADGRRVRRGMLFRSGALCALTELDYRHLDGLGLRVVYDLRSNDERKAEPTAWRGGTATEHVAWDYSMREYAGVFMQLLSTGFTPEALQRVMAGFYAQLPFGFAEHYRQLFASVLTGRVPLAFHCSAGKDRTGVAAALLLAALGVPRETVVADYLHSNTCLPADAARRAGEVMRVPPELAEAMARVERPWIESAFAAIEARDGSLERYLEHQLGVGSSEIVRLRTLCLE
jgi:protein-tyrosine phosphatase